MIWYFVAIMILAFAFQFSANSKQQFSPLTVFYTYLEITLLVAPTVELIMFTKLHLGLATVFHQS